jgi:hypothetical protein
MKLKVLEYLLVTFTYLLQSGAIFIVAGSGWEVKWTVMEEVFQKPAFYQVNNYQ